MSSYVNRDIDHCLVRGLRSASCHWDCRNCRTCCRTYCRTGWAGTGGSGGGSWADSDVRDSVRGSHQVCGSYRAMLSPGTHLQGTCLPALLLRATGPSMMTILHHWLLRTEDGHSHDVNKQNISRSLNFKEDGEKEKKTIFEKAKTVISLAMRQPTI